MQALLRQHSRLGTNQIGKVAKDISGILSDLRVPKEASLTDITVTYLKRLQINPDSFDLNPGDLFLLNEAIKSLEGRESLEQSVNKLTTSVLEEAARKLKDGI